MPAVVLFNKHTPIFFVVHIGSADTKGCIGDYCSIRLGELVLYGGQYRYCLQGTGLYCRDIAGFVRIYGAWQSLIKVLEAGFQSNAQLVVQHILHAGLPSAEAGLVAIILQRAEGLGDGIIYIERQWRAYLGGCCLYGEASCDGQYPDLYMS